MFWLILGLLIWSGAHLFKRVMPDARNAMEAKLGVGPWRGVIALLLVLSIVLMVIGYKQASTASIFVSPHWTHYLAIVMNYSAIVLMGAANAKSHIRGWLRHPMLTGIIFWSVAHIMVAGSVRAFVLWGGMIIWAVVEIVLINKQSGPYTPYKGGTAKGDVILLLVSAVLTAVIMGIHHWKLGH